MTSQSSEKPNVPMSQGGDQPRWTRLPQHRRVGKRLITPFNDITNMRPVSWRNDALPDILWIATLAGNLPRARFLELIRAIIRPVSSDSKRFDKTYVTHSVLASVPDDLFDQIMKPILNDDACRKLLGALLLFDCLPDKHHWARHLTALESKEGLPIIAKGVLDCLDHQSEQATDCRWVKIAYMMAIGKVHLPDREMVLGIAYYPNHGDLRMVRPTIRATEIAFRDLTIFGNPKPWSEEFWQECWEKTSCYLPQRVRPESPNQVEHLTAFLRAYTAVLAHFYDTVATTGLDARHDGAFGLGLYGMYLGMSASRGNLAVSAEGRILVRAFAEATITLKYLAAKDSPELWRQFRNFGTGQAKLAFLKIPGDADSASDHQVMSKGDLEMYASEDAWLEFQNVDVGAWADVPLRKMSEDAGCKDIYDRYYDVSSAYVHANWLAVRDLVLEVCHNPLHRLHRVPAPPRVNMPDIHQAALDLADEMLKSLDALYPGGPASVADAMIPVSLPASSHDDSAPATSS